MIDISQHGSIVDSTIGDGGILKLSILHGCHSEEAIRRRSGRKVSALGVRTILAISMNRSQRRNKFRFLRVRGSQVTVASSSTPRAGLFGSCSDLSRGCYLGRHRSSVQRSSCLRVLTGYLLMYCTVQKRRRSGPSTADPFRYQTTNTN